MANKIWIGTDGAYSTNGNWSPANVPGAGDHVRIPAGGGSITTGLDQSAVAIGDFIVEEGYTGTIGTSTGYLIIDPDRFEFSGTGIAYINIGSAAITATVKNSATPATGKRGLYLKGSAISTLNVMAGYVGVAVQNGETSTITTARVAGGNASLWLGAGVTLTTLQQLGGSNELRCAATTVTVQGGTLKTTEIGAITTVTVSGGATVFPESTGTITTLTVTEGTVDFRTSSLPRTVTTLNQNPTLSGSNVYYDPAVVTVTTYAQANGPVRQQRVSP